MKNKKLSIDFEWLNRDHSDSTEIACLASICLKVGDYSITQLQDHIGQTVRNNMRGSAHLLALWFVENWWRLRSEPISTQRNIDWMMSHCLSSVDGGYVWPNASFSCDGEFIEIHQFASGKSAAYEPVTYLNHVHSAVSIKDFEDVIDCFVEGVISRIDSLSISDQMLSDLWGELREERNNPDCALWRKFEAMAGFDPDEAPDLLMEAAIEKVSSFGESAVGELIVGASSTFPELFAYISSLPKKPTFSKGGVRAALPDFQFRKPRKYVSLEPWVLASSAAEQARKQWGLSEIGPVSNKDLSERLDISEKYISKGNRSNSVIPVVGVRSEESLDVVDVYIDKTREVSRRFALGRMIGDHLLSKTRERILPATESRTARQKYQRAFAQELLCPYKGLLDFISGKSINEELIHDAAKHYNVSELMVTSTLVNHNDLSRDALLSA